MKHEKKMISALLIFCLAAVASSVVASGQPNEAYAANDYTEQITSIESTSVIQQLYVENGYYMEITQSGNYYFELAGGAGEDRSAYSVSDDSGVIYRPGFSGNGSIINGYVELKKGDVIYIDVGNNFAGGKTTGYTYNSTWGLAAYGGHGVALKVNGKDDDAVVMVAGGGGGGSGVSSHYYKAISEAKAYKGLNGSASTELIEKEQFDRNNKIGGGGAGGNGTRIEVKKQWYCDPGGNGEAGGPDGSGGAGGVSRYSESNGKYSTSSSTAGECGKSYVNPSVVKSYGFQAACSTKPYAKIVLESLSAGGGDIDMNLLTKPIITVAQGVPFQTFIAVYDDITTGTVDGISFVNTDTEDGIVEVSGCLNSTGRRKVVKDKREIWFNVIPAPTASTIEVSFD